MHGLLWAAPIALCIAAAAGWMWLQSPAPVGAPGSMAPVPAPDQHSVEPALPDHSVAKPDSGAEASPERVPAEAMDAASVAGDPVAAEYRAAKDRYERAYHAYTILITEGGSGSVIAARDEYAAAYEDLKRIEAAHPEYAQ